MMRMQLVMRWGHLLDFLLDRQRRFAGRQTGSIFRCGIYACRQRWSARQRQYSKRHWPSADARHGFQRFAITRHIAVMMGD